MLLDINLTIIELKIKIKFNSKIMKFNNCYFMILWICILCVESIHILIDIWLTSKSIKLNW